MWSMRQMINKYNCKLSSMFGGERRKRKQGKEEWKVGWGQCRLNSLDWAG